MAVLTVPFSHSFQYCSFKFCMATFKAYAGTSVCLTQYDPRKNSLIQEDEVMKYNSELYPHKLYKLGLC